MTSYQIPFIIIFVKPIYSGFANKTYKEFMDGMQKISGLGAKKVIIDMTINMVRLEETFNLGKLGMAILLYLKIKEGRERN